jgi:hypothetical protein
MPTRKNDTFSGKWLSVGKFVTKNAPVLAEPVHLEIFIGKAVWWAVGGNAPQRQTRRQ